MTTSNGQEQVFHNAQSYFESMIECMSVAKKRIYIEFYTIEEDKLGSRFMDCLLEASRRGVKVYIITDGVGSKRLSKSKVQELQRAGILFEFYNGLTFQADFKENLRLSQKVAVFLRTYLLLKINKRNHRKLCVVDDKMAFVGSANISDVHVQETDFGPAWRDTGFKVSDNRVLILKEAFELTWKFIVKKRLGKRVLQAQSVQTNLTPISRKKNLSGLKKRIREAKKRVWITNPYFVPTPCILKELKNAHRRGVDVVLLLGKLSDHKFFPWINSIFYRPLTNLGVKVYLYRPSVLHSKVTIIDERAISGSSNLNHRSLFHDLELDLYIKNDKVIQELADQFKRDLLSSSLVSCEKAHQEFKSMDYLIPAFRLIKSYF